MPFDRILTNRVQKQISIQREIVITTNATGSLKYHKDEEIHPRLEKLMDQWSSKNQNSMTASRTRESDACKTTSSYAHDETHGGGRGVLTCRGAPRRAAMHSTIEDHDDHAAESRQKKQNSSKHDDETAGGGRGALTHTHSDVPLSNLRKSFTTNSLPNHDDEKYITEKHDETTISTKTTRARHYEERAAAKTRRKAAAAKQKNTKGANTHIEVSFVVIQKKVQSLHSSDRFEELLKEIDGCKWDAILLCET